MNPSLKFFLLASLALVNGAAIQGPRISCRDQNNNPIDWFTLYKLPKDSDHASNPFIRLGSGYTYMSDNYKSWTLSEKAITDPSSHPGNTLRVLYETDFTKNPDIGFVLYNDQAFGSDKSNRAHAKGIILFDKDTAIWMTHSIPEFPLIPDFADSVEYYIDSSQLKYGQSMICLTMPFSQLSKIGNQLLYAWPQVYSSYVPASLKLNPVLHELDYVISDLRYVSNSRTQFLPPNRQWFNMEKLSTLKNKEFLTFYKNTAFYDDLYAAFLANYTKSEFMTETWSNGVGNLPTNCTVSYPVYNIKNINFSQFGTSFKVNSDHSKWAVSMPKTDSSPVFACVGDINRQSSQYKRGGGTICFNNDLDVWKSYNNIVDEVEPCPLN